jgi:hypothetical protein
MKVQTVADVRKLMESNEGVDGEVTEGTILVAIAILLEKMQRIHTDIKEMLIKEA